MILKVQENKQCLRTTCLTRKHQHMCALIRIDCKIAVLEQLMPGQAHVRLHSKCKQAFLSSKLIRSLSLLLAKNNVFSSFFDCLKNILNFQKKIFKLKKSFFLTKKSLKSFFKVFLSVDGAK